MEKPNYKAKQTVSFEKMVLLALGALFLGGGVGAYLESMGVVVAGLVFVVAVYGVGVYRIEKERSLIRNNIINKTPQNIRELLGSKDFPRSLMERDIADLERLEAFGLIYEYEHSKMKLTSEGGEVLKSYLRAEALV